MFAVALIGMIPVAEGADEALSPGHVVPLSAPKPAPAGVRRVVVPASPGLPQERTPDFFKVGLRYTWFRLKDRSRPADGHDNFLGSIDKLEEEQNDLPFPVLSFAVIPNLEVAVSWDEIRAKTITRSDGHTDGTYDVYGPTLTGVVKFPVNAWCTPYLEAGAGFYVGDFDHDPAWRHVGNDRRMSIGNAIGGLFAIGCDARMGRHWHGQVFWRHVEVSVDDQYFLNGRLRADESIPLDNEGWGLGLSRAF